MGKKGENKSYVPVPNPGIVDLEHQTIGSCVSANQNSQIILCMIPIGCGTIMGLVTAALVGSESLVFIGAFVGAGAGLCLAPFHLTFLPNKPLDKAIPAVYSPAALCWVCSLPFVQPIASLIVVFVTIIIMCAIVFLLMSDYSPPGVCSVCDYDLTGNTSGVCPECGTTIRSNHSRRTGTDGT